MNHATEEMTLAKYGTSFQLKVITLLLTDYSFINQIHDVLQEKIFDDKSNAALWRLIKEYFIKYSKIPTIPALKVLIVDNVESEIGRLAIVENLKAAYRFVNADDLQFVRDNIIDFCRSQHVKEALIYSGKLARENNFESIVSIINVACAAGADRNLGYDYERKFESRLTMSRTAFGTP